MTKQVTHQDILLTRFVNSVDRSVGPWLTVSKDIEHKQLPFQVRSSSSRHPLLVWLPMVV